MATQSRESIAQEALEELQATPAGIDANAEDAEKAKKAFDRVYALMEGEGLAPFPSSAVPEEAQHAFIWMVKVHIAPAFGRGADFPKSDLKRARRELTQALKLAKSPSGIPFPKA